MELQEILTGINSCCCEVFDNPSLVITVHTTANDVEEWDSLTHIQLVVAVEKYFKMRFTSAEIMNFRNVGDMCEGVKKKLDKQQ